jgi:hypothetical protein
MLELEVEADAEGRTEATCAERDALFRDPEASCEDFSSVQWSEVPW